MKENKFLLQHMNKGMEVIMLWVELNATEKNFLNLKDNNEFRKIVPQI